MARNLPQVIQDTLGNFAWQVVQMTARAETAEAQLAEAQKELSKLRPVPEPKPAEGGSQ